MRKIQGCEVVFTLPLIREGFLADLEDEQKDFVRSCCPIWSKYLSDVVRPWQRSSGLFRKLGVRVHEFVSFDDFAAVVNGSMSAVVVLVAHWSEGSVEFANGLVPYGRVASSLPDQWRGILDLCVCHPVELVKEIKAQRSYCLVRFSNRRASLAIWLKIYEAIFLAMAREDIDFLDAVERVTVAFRDERETK